MEQIQRNTTQFSPRLVKIREAFSILRLRQQRPSWGEILKFFSNMPPDIYLNEVMMKDTQLQIKGMIVEEGEDSKLILPRFIESLQKGVFKNARFVSYSKKLDDDNNQTEFEIIADIVKVKW